MMGGNNNGRSRGSVLRSAAGATLALAFCGLMAGPAAADTVTFSNIVAKWVGGTPASNVTYVNNNYTTNPQAYWGGYPYPYNNDSGYTFQSPGSPVSVVVPPSPSSDFVLGTFQHINQPIPTGSSITGINLLVQADLQIGATDLGVQTFAFHFTHTETPNGDNPCANGQPNGSGVNSNGCADHVQVSVLTTTSTFTIGTDVYTINIIGFEQDGVLTSSFWTREGATNTADLIANVDLFSHIPTAPEASTWAMMLIGFVGLGAAGRRAAASRRDRAARLSA